MKMVLGNVLFGIMMAGWYFYVEGKPDWMLSGAVLGFACFLTGIFMGYLLRGPGKRRAAQRPATAFATDGFPVGIPVAYPEHVPVAFAAPHPAETILPVVAPDIPGPDELDAPEQAPAPVDKQDLPAEVPGNVDIENHHRDSGPHDAGYVATVE